MSCQDAVLSPEKTGALPNREAIWKRYHQDADHQVEDELVRQYLPLVKMIVGRVVMNLPAHIRMEDLYGPGLVGLLQALRNYRANSGASFETYARNRIRGAVLDELRRLDWAPRSVHDKARRIQAALGELEQRTGTVPTEADVAKALGISPEEYARWLDDIRPATFVSLDTALHPDGGDAASLYEGVADETQEEPGETVARRELSKIVAERIKSLPEAQRRVLSFYYYEDMRLKEIAVIMGVTESRISQIHSQAVLSIRSYLRQYEARNLPPAHP